MTPQEMMAEELRKQQELVKTLSQSGMTPEQMAQYMEQSGFDPDGQESMYSDLLRGGQAALFSETPKAQQYGNIVARPSWSESLNSAVQKGVGGWQMRQARQGQEALNEKSALAKTAEAKIAAEKLRMEQLSAAQKAQLGLVGDMAANDLKVQGMDRADARALAAEQGRNKRALAKATAAGESGDLPFKGTSIEAQALNSQWPAAAAKGMTMEQYRQAVGAQRLGRETTIVTPQGTQVQPGYDLGFINTGEEGKSKDARFVPKPATDAQRRSEYTVSSMQEYDKRATDYTPTALEAIAYERGPGELKGGLVSNEFKEQRENAGEWAANMVFLKSGATARKDEVDRAVTDFWPAYGDDEEDVKRKAENRKIAMREAEEAYLSREGKPKTTNVDDLLEIY